MNDCTELVKVIKNWRKFLSRLVGLFTLLVSLLTLTLITAKDLETARHKKILILTIPKAGTHLIEQIVREITKSKIHIPDPEHIREELFDKSSSDNSFFLDHL